MIPHRVRCQRHIPRVVQQCDLYLRCSDRDGDAVAIREAMYLHTPVVASNCVARPAGVTIFRSGDSTALASAIVEALDLPRFSDEDSWAKQQGQHANSVALCEVYARISGW